MSRDFEEHFRKTSRMISIAVVVSMVLAVAGTGGFLWIAYRLVTHFLG